MQKISAGIVLYHTKNGEKEFLLVHPGGPFFVRKDEGVWSIPKGEADEEDLLDGASEAETLLSVAKREFLEEIGFPVPEGECIPLGTIKQKSGKIVHAWGIEGDIDVSKSKSNTFSIEWPLNSGKMQDFPEVDKAEFFTLEEAKRKINPSQLPFLKKLSS